MLLILFLLVFVLMLSYLLFSPLQIIIDSQQALYAIRWKGLMEAGLNLHLEEIAIRLKVFFWEKDLFPLRRQPEPVSQQKIAKKKKKKSSLSPAWRKKVWKLLKSFEVKQFQLDLDTDNYIYNSYLWPVCYFLSNHKNRQLSINYDGRVKVLVLIENRLYRMIKAMIF